MVNLWFVHGVEMSALVEALKIRRQFLTEKDFKVIHEACAINPGIESPTKTHGEGAGVVLQCLVRRERRKEESLVLLLGKFKSPFGEKLGWRETELAARCMIEDAGHTEAWWKLFLDVMQKNLRVLRRRDVQGLVE